MKFLLAPIRVSVSTLHSHENVGLGGMGYFEEEKRRWDGKKSIIYTF